MTLVEFGRLERILTATADRKEFFASEGGRELVREALDGLRAKNDAKVLSLDIFDTFLLRDNTSEIRRFVEIGAKFAESVNIAHMKSVTALDGFVARQLGADLTYRLRETTKGAREGSLREIHRSASELLLGKSGMEEIFEEIELNYESEHVCVNNCLLEYAKSFRRRGGAVILITDMYMHEAQLRRLMQMKSVDPNLFASIFSSADHGISKQSGGIFSLVEDKMGKQSATFLHVGDNLVRDFRLPKQMGWEAQHLPISAADITERQSDEKACTTYELDGMARAAKE